MTLIDWQLLSLALKSSNLNEDFERLLTTLKDRQRLAAVPKDPDTRINAKDHQR